MLTLDDKYRFLIKQASKMSNLNESELMHSRTRNNVIYRHIILYMLRQLGYTYIDIGKTTGYNHSSVIYACNNVRGSIEHHYDQQVLDTYKKFSTLIKLDKDDVQIFTTRKNLEKWLKRNNISELTIHHLLENISSLS